MGTADSPAVCQSTTAWQALTVEGAMVQQTMAGLPVSAAMPSGGPQLALPGWICFDVILKAMRLLTSHGSMCWMVHKTSPCLIKCQIHVSRLQHLPQCGLRNSCHSSAEVSPQTCV